MKNIITCLIFVLFFSCNTKSLKNELCVSKIYYINQNKKLIPSVIKIKIDGDDYEIYKRIKNSELKKVLLYSIKKEYRNFFPILVSFKKEEPITITLIASFFDANRDFDKKTDWKHNWNKEEIEKTIYGDIGLVFKEDTIRIRICNLSHPTPAAARILSRGSLKK